ncbi:MAG: hypothetical protein JRD93_13770 [Deltaproteobacteria bacterium]|nr:hypothetical protein [Deltaproteobacteria bacterium]
MWLIYRKSNQKIAGMSADCEPDLDKDFALKEVVKGLIDGGSPDEYDGIQISHEEALTIMSTPPDWLILRKRKSGELELAVEEPKPAMLMLKSDAPDVHEVDGIPEIAADGKSFTMISVQKIDDQVSPLQRKKDDDVLYLRIDYGTLQSADGSKEIRTINLVNGKAIFRLVSEKARRVATVQVFNSDPNLIDSSIRIEFI